MEFVSEKYILLEPELHVYQPVTDQSVIEIDVLVRHREYGLGVGQVCGQHKNLDTGWYCVVSEDIAKIDYNLYAGQ
jgi:hypothetical protein